jgi:hypothetical protein
MGTVRRPKTAVCVELKMVQQPYEFEARQPTEKRHRSVVLLFVAEH